MTSAGDDRREPPRFSIMMVCLGNICRSPMAAAVLRGKLAAAGLGDVVVDSAGTSHWHIGDPADPRAAATLAAAGYDPTHVAQQFQAVHVRDYDLVLVMDEENLRAVTSLSLGGGDVRKFRSFDPAKASVGPIPDVPDPYYGDHDGFALVLAMVERTSDAIVGALATGQLVR